MELEDSFAPRHLMQSVDILRDNCVQLTGAFKLGKLLMTLVGLRIGRYHALAVKRIKLSRMGLIERMGEHHLGRIVEMLMVQAIDAPKIRDTACCRNTRTTEKHDTIMRVEQLGKLVCRLTRIVDSLSRHTSPLSHTVALVAIMPAAMPQTQGAPIQGRPLKE